MKPEEEDDEESLAIGSHMTERDYLRLGKDDWKGYIDSLDFRVNGSPVKSGDELDILRKKLGSGFTNRL